jgi:hypothetical protein
MNARIEHSIAYIRQNGATVLAEGLANFVLPYLIYIYTKDQIGDVRALMASSAPPIVWSLIEFARTRRVDALSVFVLLGIVLSLLAFIGGGSVRLLQLRENLVNGLIALVFLGSAAIGRPLIYQLARASIQRRSAEEVKALEQHKDNAGFRRTMTVMTLVWGFGLLLQTAIACALVFTLSIQTYLLVAPFFGYGTMGALALWTFFYVRRAQRLGDARRAREADAAATAAAALATEKPS